MVRGGGMKPESCHLNLRRNSIQPTQRHGAAKPQPKAEGFDRGVCEIRGKRTSSRFDFRVFGVFRGLSLS
jgi:hypothetical protein